eukprot:PhF_6_TR38660/c0_g3_i1/m.57784
MHGEVPYDADPVGIGGVCEGPICEGEVPQHERPREWYADHHCDVQEERCCMHCLVHVVVAVAFPSLQLQELHSFVFHHHDHGEHRRTDDWFDVGCNVLGDIGCGPYDHGAIQHCVW